MEGVFLLSFPPPFPSILSPPLPSSSPPLPRSLTFFPSPLNPFSLPLFPYPFLPFPSSPLPLVDYCKRTSDVSSRQRLRSANRYQLIVPRHRRSMFGRRAFSVAGPMEWNSLPDSLRDPARSTDSFRSALKTHLFAALQDD